MDQLTNPDICHEDIIEVIIGGDGMVGYIKLEKCGEAEQPVPVTADQMMEALEKNRVVYGIKETAVQKLATRPIYGIKIEVARGKDPVDGEDGYVKFFVKRNSEYKPTYSEEGTIDYKNLDYFQQVTEGQLLCEVVKETDGTEGMNIFGAVVPAKRGRPAASPMGKNTLFNEDETQLTAACDGVVRFLKDHIDINEALQIRSNVDQMTGNINFKGDVVIDGDVCYGFSVKSGGNVTVKGVVEGASVEAAGDIYIGRGINGAGGKKVIAGGKLRSGYIENAELEVKGDILTDNIIDSNILCNGNVELAGKNELVVGGHIRVFGELSAKHIGNRNERPTKIEVMSVVADNSEAIAKLKSDRDQYNADIVKIIGVLNELSRPGVGDGEDLVRQVNTLREQLALLKEQIELANRTINELEKEDSVDYPGSIICKGKLYQGVKIYFGSERFRFTSDYLERCRILWHKGEITQGTL